MIDHELLSRLFLEASALPPDERASFLDGVCGDDAALRSEIDAMLRVDADAAGSAATARIAANVARVAGEVLSTVSVTVPEQIGPYKILGVLGEGGMGVVYRAAQVEPIRREVALKVLRGGLDSAAFLARFEAERQALASMDHPNVARVLDAGADASGQPYLAMELVQGTSITEYIRSSELDLRRKVRLFLDVCRGVGHAHQRGIIHRDLKPSNILVTRVHGEPVPKVIDFSIAKALAEPMMQTAFRTRTGQVVGTLEYMSPEQASGRVDAIDTRSDVYSLGILLYQIVTGGLPHDLSDLPLHEAVRRIVEEPPRTLRGTRPGITLRGTEDLDTIIAKCLEKDPDRRYGGASQLAEDLDRYLASRPILARPPSTTYQLRKLVGRHRMASAIIALSVLFLLIFTVTVSVELGVQRRERVRAEMQARKAERVSRFMQEVYRDTGLDLGHDATIRDALAFAADRVKEDNGDDPLARSAVLEAIGMSYGNFDEFDKGLTFLQEALGILQSQPDPDDPEIGRLYWEIAMNLERAQKLPESEEAVRHAVEIHQARAKEDPEPLVGDLGLLALVEIGEGKFDDAERHLRWVLKMYDEVLPQNSDNWNARMTEQENLANVLQRRGRVGESEAIVRKILEEREKAGLDLGMTPFNLAFLLRRQEKCEEAEERFQEVIDRARAKQGDRHPVIGRAFTYIGACLAERGRYEEAEADMRKGLAFTREALGEESLDYATGLEFLGELLYQTDRVDEAEEDLRSAMQLRVKQYGEEHRAVAHDLSRLGAALEAGGRWTEAEDLLRSAVAMVERTEAPDDVDVAYRLGDLAGFLARRGRFAEALPLHDRALKILQIRHDDGSPELAAANGVHAWILDGLGRYELAETYRGKAIAWIRKVLGEEHPRMAWQLYRRAAALRKQGRAEEALPVAREAVAMERRVRGEKAPELAEMSLETAEILDVLGQHAAAGSSARAALALWEGRSFVDPDLLARAHALSEPVQAQGVGRR